VGSRLHRLKVANFRSIRGTLEVPLDADIVLIHGLNGAGKTSVMSAIELGLTGKVAAVQQLAMTPSQYLIHDGAQESQVTITATSKEMNGEFVHSSLRVSPRTIEGTALLDADDARFLVERSYLAQATLGRLLEMYQVSDKRGGSLLTSFVNDLLGLDQLDALIDGLDKAANLNWAKSLVPEFESHNRRTELLISDLARTRGLFAAAIGEVHAAESRIKQLRVELGETDVRLEGRSESEILKKLDDLEAELVTREDVRTRAEVLFGLVVSNDNPRDETDFSSALAGSAKAADAYRLWDERVGLACRSLRERINTIGLPADNESLRSPEFINLLTSDVTRMLARHASEADARHTALTTAESLRVSVARLASQIEATDLRLSSVLTGAQNLSRAAFLTSAIPLVADNACPICEREYSEVSELPLVEHLRATARTITQHADEIDALQNERRLNHEQLNAVRAEYEIQSALAFTATEKTPAEVASLRSLQGDLRTHLESIEAGRQLRVVAAAAQDSVLRIEELRQRRSHIARQAAELIGNPLELRLSTLSSTLESFSTLQTERVRTLHQQTHKLRELRNAYGALDDLKGQSHAHSESMVAFTVQLKSQEAMTAEADRRIVAARNLAKAAGASRQQITSEIFNERLNGTWRDLFVRLAPSEPFVPRFRFAPKASGLGKVELEVVHRNGHTKGEPAALLSAGNLNTAALTLFIALHLVAKPQLPWVLLDDPVQSMDDVHVSQLATLVKELAGVGKRQIILAVHEKALFDYLKFELSPGSPNQSLLAVEIQRSPVGDTRVKHERIVWKPDTAFGAANMS